MSVDIFDDKLRGDILRFLHLKIRGIEKFARRDYDGSYDFYDEDFRKGVLDINDSLKRGFLLDIVQLDEVLKKKFSAESGLVNFLAQVVLPNVVGGVIGVVVDEKERLEGKYDSDLRGLSEAVERVSRLLDGEAPGRSVGNSQLVGQDATVFREWI